MSNTQRAAVALRHTIVGALSSPHGDSLVGLSTVDLPNGAEAFVIATKATYRLDKLAAQSEAAPSPVNVVPTVGLGVWVLTPGDAAASAWAAFDGTANFTGAATQAVVQNTWHALPVPGDASVFYESTGPDDYFTISPTTGIITYVGPDNKTFSVTANFSMYCATATQIGEVAVDESLLGTTTTTQVSSRAGMGVAAAPTTLSLTAVLTFLNGDTLQHVFRNITATPGNVGFFRYVVSITAL